MPELEGPATPGAADQPTRLQRAARRSCAGLAYAIVLAPVVAVIWFFSSIPRGWEQFGDLMWKIFWEGSPGADTEIVCSIIPDAMSGFVIRYWDQEIHRARGCDDRTNPATPPRRERAWISATCLR